MKYNPPRAEVLNQAISTVVSACNAVFEDKLECIILKGSAVKGDFIQGYSDFDFHVFLNSAVMDGERSPEVGGAVAFQKRIGEIHPRDFGASQFQIFFLNARTYPEDWIPPIGGTYKVLWGKTPSCLQEVDDSAYLQNARQAVSNIQQDKRRLIERFVDKPNSRIPTFVRLLGQYLKGHIYSSSILLTSQPNAVLNMKLDELLSVVEHGIGSKGRVSKFYEYISNWPTVQEKCGYAREAFKAGIEALDEIGAWVCAQTLTE
jgi:hypothetical protein